jgi:hypothetical protein
MMHNHYAALMASYDSELTIGTSGCAVLISHAHWHRTLAAAAFKFKLSHCGTVSEATSRATLWATVTPCDRDGVLHPTSYDTY